MAESDSSNRRQVADSCAAVVEASRKKLAN
jgi:hypothetical protein